MYFSKEKTLKLQRIAFIFSQIIIELRLISISLVVSPFSQIRKNWLFSPGLIQSSIQKLIKIRTIFHDNT